MNFWKIVKEVSTLPIRQEAERPFLLGVCGSPAFIQKVVDELMGPGATAQERAMAEARLACVPAPVGVEGVATLSRCDLVLAGPDSPEAARIRPAEVAPLVDPGLTSQLLLERRPDWHLALARHFPGMRPRVSERIIQSFSKVNAEFALISAVPGVLPAIAPFLPVALPMDIAMLTKNQVMMVLRLAAAHGRTPEPRARLREIAPVIGAAFGWRAMARELVGLVPGGVGMALKASIAYAGTFATGRAAVFYYDVGRHPTRIELRGFRREGTRRARTAVSEALERLKRGPD
jgi:uncharacterized protein (DUF697 family)